MAIAEVRNEHAKANTRLAILLCNVGHFYTHTFTILYATAVLYLPSVFGLPYGEMLGLAAFGLILYGVAALPAGWLADRWSKVGMMIVFFFGIGASTLVVGMAESTYALFIGLSLLGLFAAIYHPVGIAWLVSCAKKQGMTLGVNAVFGNLGSALAPVFVGMMIDYGNWRLAFLVPGVLALITGMGMLLAWSQGRITDLKADTNPAPPPTVGGRRRVLLLLTLTMACNGLIYTGLLNTMPKLFENGLGDALAGNYTELGLMAGAVIGLSSFSSIFGGWLADRFSPRSVYLIFLSLSVPPLLLVSHMTGPALLVIVLLALSFNVTFAAAENMLVARYTPFKWRSVAYGARFVLALGIGGVTVRLAGWLYDQTGDFNLVYVIFGGAAIAATVGVFLLPAEPRQAAAEIAPRI